MINQCGLRNYLYILLIIDIDECANGTHGCEQRCINTPGSYKCGCNESYILKEDQKTCAPRMYIEGQAGIRPNETEAETELSKGGCMAPCAAVLRLEDKAKEMEEKVIKARYYLLLIPHFSTEPLFTGTSAPSLLPSMYS